MYKYPIILIQNANNVHKKKMKHQFLMTFHLLNNSNQCFFYFKSILAELAPDSIYRAIYFLIRIQAQSPLLCNCFFQCLLFFSSQSKLAFSIFNGLHVKVTAFSCMNGIHDNTGIAFIKQCHGKTDLST